MLYRFVYIVVLYHRTNDGELKQALERSSLKRKYRVRLRGAIPATMADDLRQGVQVDGIQYAPIEMTLTRPDSMQNQWVDITLQEGKNRYAKTRPSIGY